MSKGKVIISKEGKALQILEQWECLGEKSLLNNDSLRTVKEISKEKVIYY